MKNKFLISILSTVLLALAIFFSCTKTKDLHDPDKILKAAIKGDFNDMFVENYILFRSTQTVNPLSFDSSFEIVSQAVFKDGSTFKNAGNLIISKRYISALPNNVYDFNYTDGNLGEGKALMGTDITLGVTGSPDIEAFTRTAYVPNQIITTTLQLPTTTVNRNQNLTLNWKPDPNSLWGRVVIQVSYYQGLSQLNNPGFPNSIAPLVYTVPDNGSFTISASDLQRFPANAYIGISIGRGTESNVTLPNTRRKIYYFTIVDAKTIPLLVIQ